MSIPTSGPLSLEQISSEFGGARPHSLSEYYRNNSLVTNAPYNETVPTSGTISIRGFYGTRGRFKLGITISANTSNFNLYEVCKSIYVPGTTDVTVTINAGVYVYSTNYQVPAFIVDSFLSSDTISIINNGSIVGAGGAGGRGSDYRYGGSIPSIPARPGEQGGTALSLSCATTITNNGTIAGGGGGGGGAGGYYYGRDKGQDDSRAGSGGGGGAGYSPGGGGQGGIATGQENNLQGAPGSAGTLTTGGAGGTANADGGAGGALGGAGFKGANGSSSGVGLGAAGGNPGYYVSGIQYVKWLKTGTLTGLTI